MSIPQQRNVTLRTVRIMPTRAAQRKLLKLSTNVGLLSILCAVTQKFFVYIGPIQQFTGAIDFETVNI